MPPLTIKILRDILTYIDFGGWLFHADHMDEGFYLQVIFKVADGTNTVQKGRKWYVSPYSVKSEVVQTAFKAVLTALEHEARESFLYQGQPIFGPHFDVDALLELSENKRISLRREA